MGSFESKDLFLEKVTGFDPNFAPGLSLPAL